MSKSLKNFKTLRDIATRPDEARAYRMMVLSAQYRSPLSFTAETLKSAANSLKRVEKLVKKLEEVRGETETESTRGDSGEGREVKSLDVAAVVASAAKGFEAGMADDLNTPRAFAALFKLVAEAEKALKRGSPKRAHIHACTHAFLRIRISKHYYIARPSHSVRCKHTTCSNKKNGHSVWSFLSGAFSLL